MRRTVSLLAAVVAAVFFACGVAFAASLSPTADTGTANTDGRVSAILASGGKVYLGGSFTQVNGVPRDHLAALDASTGQLTDWNPGANGNVLALAASAGGTRIYAAGDFTTVGGVARQRVAALSASTGAVVKTWNVKANGEVYALAVSRKSVYLGGSFTKVNGKPRNHLAKVGARTGTVTARWAPSTNGSVRTLALSGKRLYLGGFFTTISGKPRHGLAALNARTGALDKVWRPAASIPVLDLEVSDDMIYSAEGGGANQQGAAAYSVPSGATAWRFVTDGDVQAVAVLDGKAYFGGHFVVFAGEPRRGFAAVDASTGTLDAAWAPSAKPLSPGVLALTPDASQTRLYSGGSFAEISGQPREFFAQFSG
jgi:trimeric autotransporter adhesin